MRDSLLLFNAVRFVLLLMAFMAMLPAPSAALPVEASHPVAAFLRRLEEKGLIHPGFWSTLPRDAAEVAEALRQAKAREGALSAWDRRRMERYLDEFDPVGKRRGTRLYYEDSLLTLRAGAEFSASGRYRDSLPRAEGYTFGSLSPSLEGTYREHLYFSAQATIGMERNRGDRFLTNYDPQRGMPYNTNRDGQAEIPQGVSTFDGFRTLVGFGDGRLAIEAGQDWNQWGPGRWQHTTLGTRPHFWAADSLAAVSLAADTASGFKGTGANFWAARRGYRHPGEGAPLPQIRLRFGGDRWEYVKIVAQRTGLAKDSSASLIAHRAQLRLGAWKFGITEMLSIGTRSPGLLLLLPGIPLKFAEHEGGDLDNAALSADVEWTWKGHGRVYGECFVDDYSGPPLNFRGNKFAVTLGGSWQDPLGLPAELHLEYAHVDPWTYGHHRYNTAFQHYGALLGSSLPPNSRAISAAAEFPLPGNLEGTAEWRFRQRDLASRGSSIFDVFDAGPPPESAVKHFLDQDVETRNELALTAAWAWRRHALFKAGAGGLWAQNWRGHAGESLATPTVFGEMTLRY